MPLRAALKAMADAVSNASKNKTTTTSNKNNSSSSTSKTYNNSNSYAYDPKGNKVNVTIKDGQSYLDDGNRVGTGYTVQTGGGIYKMGDDGKGVKVDSHNTVVNTPTTKISTNKNSNNDSIPSNMNSSTKALINNLGNKTIGAYAKEGTFEKSNYDYKNKYNDLIKAMATSEGVDMSVGKEMLDSNLLMNDKNLYGKGLVDYGNWDSLRQDYYNMVRNPAIESVNQEGRRATDSYGRSVNTSDLVNPNYKPTRQDINSEQVQSLVDTLSSYTQPINNVAINNNEPINNSQSNNVQFIPLDNNNPDMGGIFDTPQGYYMEYEGERVPLSDEEYIELMETILGF